MWKKRSSSSDCRTTFFFLRFFFSTTLSLALLSRACVRACFPGPSLALSTSLFLSVKSRAHSLVTLLARESLPQKKERERGKGEQLLFSRSPAFDHPQQSLNLDLFSRSFSLPQLFFLLAKQRHRTGATTTMMSWIFGKRKTPAGEFNREKKEVAFVNFHSSLTFFFFRRQPQQKKRTPPREQAPARPRHPRPRPRAHGPPVPGEEARGRDQEGRQGRADGGRESDGAEPRAQPALCDKTPWLEGAAAGRFPASGHAQVDAGDG